MNDATMIASGKLGWLVRLPPSGERELAGLLGVQDADVRRTLHDLGLRGRVDSVEPGSPELERRRRYFVSEDTVAAWCAAREVTAATLAQTLPVGRNDLLKRIACIEVTTGVNRLCAELAADLRRAGLAELVDARSLPLSGRAAERWWLHGVDGYGCLGAGRLYAPFLIAWDRAAAPDLHRRQRAALWHREAKAVRAHWGEAGLPPLLLVCPTTREADVWLHALANHADNGASPPLGVFVTTRRGLREHGAGGAAWRSAGGEEKTLVEQIGWGPEPSVTAPPGLFDGIADIETVDRRRHGALRRWAAQHATAAGARVRWQHTSALALATGAAEQTLVEWMARHPLLSVSDLAELLGEPAALIARRLEWLVRCRAVAPVRLHQPMPSEGVTT